MKVISKEIKDCEETNWDKVQVLDLKYTHKGETGRVLIHDYDDVNYKEILKRLRVEVKNHYANQKVLAEHHEARK